jgi:RimJ/RimL family protein N-acetyltransferase
MFEVWDKNRIQHLTLFEKEQWFEVLNYKLEEDRDISLNDPELSKKQQEIKEDYLNYIESCYLSKNFYKYYVWIEHSKIISVCRINIYDEKYILEGLQTHKDYYRKGYASKLLDLVLFDLYKHNIDTLYSDARVWNDASNRLQTKLGFIKYGQDEYNYLYKIRLKSYLKHTLKLGFDIFGKAYGVMYRNDLHHKKSIDYQLIKNMILIDEKSKYYLYDQDRPFVSTELESHELFDFSKQFKDINDMATIKRVLNYTYGIVNNFNVRFESMRFGGTEKEIIVRGSDWCTDISRVGCAILQCLNIPCRMAMIANVDYAYNGHTVCEAYINNEYILCDFTYGVMGETGKRHSVYELIQNNEQVNIIYRNFAISELKDYFIAMFSRAAISFYDIKVKHDYLVSKPNDYYKKLMKIMPDGMWHLGEDSKN